LFIVFFYFYLFFLLYSNATASSELSNSGIKDRAVFIAKTGFLVLTALLAVQIFMKAVYLAHL